MSALLRRTSRRYLLRHPGQAALATLGIALGVAVTVAVALATTSARRAFELSTDAVVGRATHQVLGGPGGLAEQVYTALRVDVGVEAAAPVLEGYARVRGQTFRLWGVDPFGEQPFRPYVGPAARGLDLSGLLTRPGAVLPSAEAARSLDLAPGDSVEAVIAGSVRSLTIAGVLDPVDALSEGALSDVLVADIATAQELTGAIGTLTRIDLRMPDGEEGVALVARVRAALPPGARLMEAGARAGSVAGLTHAFEVNLTALALLALVFGMFLIYNTITFSVVQRRELIGLLRALGVTRGEVLRQVLGEALAIGAVATVLGLALGILLGGGLVRLVARTINDLYFTVTVTGVTVTPAVMLRGALLGIGATLLAALPPALEAVRATPRASQTRSLVESRFRTGARLAALAGAGIGAAGIAVLLVPTRDLIVSFVGLFLLIVAGALLAPAATVALMTALRRPAGFAFGFLGRVATRGVAATLSRTGPAIAALSVAVAVGIAVGLMIGSFRGTVARWLDASLQADIYVSTPGMSASGTDARLPSALIERLRGFPGVAGVSTYRDARIALDAGELRLVAIDMYPAHRRAFTFAAGGGDEVWRTFAGGGLLVSESFAYRRGLKVGDTLELSTDRGPRGFTVAGVFFDYATEHGVAFVDRAVYRRWWDDDAITSAGVFVEPGEDRDGLIDRLRAIDTGDAVVLFRSNRELRDASLRVFDRTFAITAVLRALALAVAFVGVLSALLALQLERTRELGVMRAIGVTPRQLGALIVAQTGLIGGAAAALAVPLGLGLGWTMIHVINRRSFGWTIDMRVDAGTLLESVAFAVVAALLAGILPAYRMARTPPAAAVRAE